MPNLLSDQRRKQAFLRLVQLQDGGTNVQDSRQSIASEFNISVDQLRNIEREGLEKDWPPLSPG